MKKLHLFAILTTLFALGQRDAIGDIVDKGPFEFDRSYYLVPALKQSAYRIQSFGNTQVQFEVHGFTEIVVEGPYDPGKEWGAHLNAPGWKKRRPIFRENIKETMFDTRRFEVTFEQPGVYAVVFSSPVIHDGIDAKQNDLFGEPERDEVQHQIHFKGSCSKNCSRHATKISKFAKRVVGDGGQDFFINRFKEELGKWLAPKHVDSWTEKLIAKFAAKDFESLDRFPVIQLSEFAQAQDYYLDFKNDKPRVKEDLGVQGELMELLGDCTAPEDSRVLIHATFHNVKYGHFQSDALTLCQKAHSKKFGDILTALSLNTPDSIRSKITYQDKVYTSAEELIEGLLASGHHVEIRHERTYANFLSMTIEDQSDLKWPVWLDTGLKVTPDSAENLIVPAGHSQHVIVIFGPEVNTQVAFFLGLFGAGYHAQIDSRPGWTGNRVESRWTTDSSAFPKPTDQKGHVRLAVRVSLNRQSILKSISVAAEYLRLVEDQSRTVFKGLPSHGYGVAGICVDSDAVFGRALGNSWTGFPLVRNPKWNEGVSGYLKDVLGRLPVDLAPTDPFDRERLLRVWAMHPHRPEDLRRHGFEKTFQEQMQILEDLFASEETHLE